MFASLLMSAAALASTPLVPAPTGNAVGPLQAPGSPAVQSGEEHSGYPGERIKPLDFDISDLSEGAELKVRAAKLKLMLPI